MDEEKWIETDGFEREIKGTTKNCKLNVESKKNRLHKRDIITHARICFAFHSQRIMLIFVILIIFCSCYQFPPMTIPPVTSFIRYII